MLGVVFPVFCKSGASIGSVGGEKDILPPEPIRTLNDPFVSCVHVISVSTSSLSSSEQGGYLLLTVFAVSPISPGLPDW